MFKIALSIEMTIMSENLIPKSKKKMFTYCCRFLSLQFTRDLLVQMECKFDVIKDYTDNS